MGLLYGKYSRQIKQNSQSIFSQASYRFIYQLAFELHFGGSGSNVTGCLASNTAPDSKFKENVIE